MVALVRGYPLELLRHVATMHAKGQLRTNLESGCRRQLGCASQTGVIQFLNVSFAQEYPQGSDNLLVDVVAVADGYPSVDSRSGDQNVVQRAPYTRGREEKECTRAFGLLSWYQVEW